MHPSLRRLSTGFESCLGGVDERATQLRPPGGPHRWSVQQIAEHLLLTYTATSENYAHRLAKGSATKSSSTLRQRLAQFYVISLGRFPPGREAPAIVVPPPDPPPLSGDRLVARAAEQLARFDGLATRAESLFGERRALTHPVLGPLNVDQWRRFHLVHGEHHLKQIAAILSANADHSSTGSSGSTPSATGR